MEIPPGPVGVLCSGGLDSAVLLVEMARTSGRAVPVFVRAGHVWEPAERVALDAFVRAVAEPRVAPVRELLQPMGDVYGADWSMTGEGTPAWDAPDEAVELRGRNLILLAKVLVVAAIEGWRMVAVGSLVGNPFPDATVQFVTKMAAAACEGLGCTLAIALPYRDLKKADVIRRGAGLPLELTLSCARPVDGRHCGACNKCRERVDAFAAAGVVDRTSYARPQSHSRVLR
jgi:7-cyano-7-deazaguanine synthase